jgi:hypothetical protein
VDEFRSAIGALPQDGLEQSAQALAQALEGAADQREDYWKNRVQPFWQQVWPKFHELASPQIAASLARVVIAAGGEFSAALAAVQPWLRPLESTDHVVHLLHKAGLCRRFPSRALLLLTTVIADQDWAPQELGQCLDDIAEADPKLAQDAGYLRLRAFLRTRRT